MLETLLGVEASVEYGLLLILWVTSIACMAFSLCELLERKKG